MRDMIVTVTFEAVYKNPNPPHVYPAEPWLVKQSLERTLENNQENLFWLDTKNRSGLFQRDSFPAASIRAYADVRRVGLLDRIMLWWASRRSCAPDRPA